jgi:hypothetical protein
MTANATVKHDETIGDKIEFTFPKKSYQRQQTRFTLYVTGMDEVAAYATGGYTTDTEGRASWFFSADDLLVLRDWLDTHIVPAKAKVISSYERKATEKTPEKTCSCCCCK